MNMYLHLVIRISVCLHPRPRSSSLTTPMEVPYDAESQCGTRGTIITKISPANILYWITTNDMEISLWSELLLNGEHFEMHASQQKVCIFIYKSLYFVSIFKFIVKNHWLALTNAVAWTKYVPIQWRISVSIVFHHKIFFLRYSMTLLGSSHGPSSLSAVVYGW